MRGLGMLRSVQAFLIFVVISRAARPPGVSPLDRGILDGDIEEGATAKKTPAAAAATSGSATVPLEESCGGRCRLRSGGPSTVAVHAFGQLQKAKTSHPILAQLSGRVQPPRSCEPGGDSWKTDARGHSCGERIEWVMQHTDADSYERASEAVGRSFLEACRSCLDRSVDIGSSNATAMAMDQGAQSLRSAQPGDEAMPADEDLEPEEVGEEEEGGEDVDGAADEGGEEDLMPEGGEEAEKKGNKTSLDGKKPGGTPPGDMPEGGEEVKMEGDKMGPDDKKPDGKPPGDQETVGKKEGGEKEGGEKEKVKEGQEGASEAGKPEQGEEDGMDEGGEEEGIPEGGEEAKEMQGEELGPDDQMPDGTPPGDNKEGDKKEGGKKPEAGKPKHGEEDGMQEGGEEGAGQEGGEEGDMPEAGEEAKEAEDEELRPDDQMPDGTPPGDKKEGGKDGAPKEPKEAGENPEAKEKGEEGVEKVDGRMPTGARQAEGEKEPQTEDGHAEEPLEGEGEEEGGKADAGAKGEEGGGEKGEPVEPGTEQEQDETEEDEDGAEPVDEDIDESVPAGENDTEAVPVGEDDEAEPAGEEDEGEPEPAGEEEEEADPVDEDGTKEDLGEPEEEGGVHGEQPKNGTKPEGESAGQDEEEGEAPGPDGEPEQQKEDEVEETGPLDNPGANHPPGGANGKTDNVTKPESGGEPEQQKEDEVEETGPLDNPGANHPPGGANGKADNAETPEGGEKERGDMDEMEGGAEGLSSNSTETHEPGDPEQQKEDELEENGPLDNPGGGAKNKAEDVEEPESSGAHKGLKDFGGETDHDRMDEMEPGGERESGGADNGVDDAEGSTEHHDHETEDSGKEEEEVEKEEEEDKDSGKKEEGKDGGKTEMDNDAGEKEMDKDGGEKEMDNEQVPTPSSSVTTCQSVLNKMACADKKGTEECLTCEQRMENLASQQEHDPRRYQKAKEQVATRFPKECGVCALSAVKLGSGYKQVWRDDFEGTRLNRSNWKFYTGRNYNEEQQQFTERSKNAVLGGGTLKITAFAEKFSGDAGNMQYTSARIDSVKSWSYGRFSVRMRMHEANVRGNWPAVWMMPRGKEQEWPNSGEIDIMQNVGYQGGTVHGTPHTGAYNHLSTIEKGGSVVKKLTDWHVFQVEWTPERIIWAVDDAPFNVFEKESEHPAVWPFTKGSKFYLILDLAVGGNWGGKEGIDGTKFAGKGQIMEVDWAMVEQKV